MRYMIAVAVLVVGLVLGCSSDPSEGREERVGRSGLSEAGLQQLHDQLQSEVDSGYVGSAVGLLALSGEIVFLDAVGEAEPGVPMQVDAITRLASITKPITATAVMILHEDGRLRLDDPVARFIPAFDDLKISSVDGNLVEPVRPVTVQDLLTHTSGIAISGPEFESVWEEAMRETDAITTRELSERIAAIPMLSQPGRVYDYGYYGSSYEVLAAIVEQVSGQTLDRFFAEHIFRPLGMHDTYFTVPEEKRSRLAGRYQRRDGGLVLAARRGEESPASGFLSGGGGLRSTARDYFRFAQCLLDGGELDGTRILRRSSVELMMTDHVGDLYPHGDGDYGWGFGGRVRRGVSTGGPAPVGTYGWNGGTGTFFWIDPRTKLVGVVFAPFNPPPPWELYGRFQRTAYRALERSADAGVTRTE